MILPWDAIRSEIEQALELVRAEIDSNHGRNLQRPDGDLRKRAALVHLRAADLLMTGTPPTAIVGTRPKGN